MIDSACQTDECLNDMEDCNMDCLDNACSEIYGIWTSLMDFNTNDNTRIYAANYTIVCNDWMPKLLAIIPPTADSFAGIMERFNLLVPEECLALIPLLDDNGDGYINYRELTSWIGIVLYAEGRYELDKGLGLNCSSCVGVDTYNIDYTNIDL